MTSIIRVLLIWQRGNRTWRWNCAWSSWVWCERRTRLRSLPDINTQRPLVYVTPVQCYLLAGGSLCRAGSHTLKRWNYVKIMRCTGCSCSCHYSDRSVIYQPQTETNYLQLLTEAEQKHSELRLHTNNHQLSSCNVKLLVTKPERSIIWLYDENIFSRL